MKNQKAAEYFEVAEKANVGELAQASFVKRLQSQLANASRGVTRDAREGEIAQLIDLKAKLEMADLEKMV